MKRRAHLLILPVAALLAVAATPVPSRAELDIYTTFSSHDWREYAEGQKVAHEQGGLYGLGIEARYAPKAPDILTLKAKIESFGGQPDFDVTDQETGTRYSGTTDLTGFKAEADMGMKLRLQGASLEPFAGIGYRWWQRDLFYGEQTWENVYGRVGLRGDVRLGARQKMYWEAGARIPISAKARFSAGPDEVSVHPGKETSAFAEAGVKMGLLKVGVFYEGLRFKEDNRYSVEYDVTSTDTLQAPFQPQTKADIVGLRIGVSF